MCWWFRRSARMILFMANHGFHPREGGVKVVFDVPEGTAAMVLPLVTAAGFTVRAYYSDGERHGAGRAEPGWIRLGAEMPRTAFTNEEEEAIVAAFDRVHGSSGFVCRRCGTDSWEGG
jgi:hypothetical protein